MLFKVQLHIVWQYAQTWRFFVFGNVVNYLQKGSFNGRHKKIIRKNIIGINIKL